MKRSIPADVTCHLAKVLKRRGISQAQLMRTLNSMGYKTTHALVNKWCTGKLLPLWPMRLVLCKLLEVHYKKMFSINLTPAQDE